MQPAFLAVGKVIRSGRTITTCRGEVYGIGGEGGRTVVALIQATLMAVAHLSDAGPTIESLRDTLGS